MGRARVGCSSVMALILAILYRLRGNKGYWSWAIGILLGTFGYVFSDSALVVPVTTLAFVAFERFGWGTWLGAILYPDKVTKKYILECDEGRNNGIHWLASKVEHEWNKDKLNFIEYSVISLFLRGVYLWLPVMLSYAYFGVFSIDIAVLNSLVCGALFPFSAILSYELDLKENKLASGKWEWSELLYGFFSGVVIFGTILALHI